MSIYQGWRQLPFDVQYHQVPGIGSAPRDRVVEPADCSHLRRQQPSSVLLPRTVHWLAELPEKIRPMTLAVQFGRIANYMCGCWGDPEACQIYFDELLIDRREGRKGFPVEVLGELYALQAYYAAMHPQRRSARR